MKKNILVIGGGTACSGFLQELAEYGEKYNISVVGSMADDGGSTGRLRREYGVSAFGALRKCLLALSEEGEEIKNTFEYRFGGGDFAGHTVGNIFMAGLEKSVGNPEKALEVLHEYLKVVGAVVPASFDKVILFAELENGQIIEGETKIDIPEHDGNLKISNVYLKPEAKANPRAIEEINSADFIVIGPGDFYTTIVPNFLVKGISEAVKKSKAKKLFIVNSFTKYGETHNFSVNDFVRSLEKYLGQNILGYVLYNNIKPENARMKKFHPGETFPELMPDRELLARYEFIGNNFVEDEGRLYFNRKKVMNIIENLM